MITILPIVGLVLGALAIATEIKANDLRPILQKSEQQLSPATVQCIKKALTVRETSVFSAVTSYQKASLAALSTRQTALLSAWDKPTKSEVKPLITTTWKTYKKTMKLLKDTLATAKKTAWSTYKTDIKACNATSLLKATDVSGLANEE